MDQSSRDSAPVKGKAYCSTVKGMFPVANGILDINKMELITEDNGKICLVRSGVVYDPDAKCPNLTSP